jgi:hypothetical protein
MCEITIAVVRAKIASIPPEERCDPGCETWAVFDTDRGFEIERCDDCWSGRLDPLTDDEAEILPEALAALANEIAEVSNGFAP